MIKGKLTSSTTPISEEYMFHTDTIARHVIYKLGGYSGVRVHKTLYFLFAIYAGRIGGLEGNPDYLFKEDFEAWEFGPVLRSLYLDSVDNNVVGIEWIPEGLYEEDLYEFIDNVIQAVNDFGDFELVRRVCEDEAWKEAYNNDPNNPHHIGKMSKERIKEEYQDN